jgi:hypothetical protein
MKVFFHNFFVPFREFIVVPWVKGFRLFDYFFIFNKKRAYYTDYNKSYLIARKNRSSTPFQQLEGSRMPIFLAGKFKRNNRL